MKNCSRNVAREIFLNLKNLRLKSDVQIVEEFSLAAETEKKRCFLEFSTLKVESEGEKSRRTFLDGFKQISKSSSHSVTSRRRVKQG